MIFWINGSKALRAYLTLEPSSEVNPNILLFSGIFFNNSPFDSLIRANKFAAKSLYIITKINNMKKIFSNTKGSYLNENVRV